MIISEPKIDKHINYLVYESEILWDTIPPEFLFLEVLLQEHA